MSIKTLIGLILIAVGVLALAYEGFSYTTNEQVMKLGPVKASVEEEKSVSIPPIAGGAAVVAGTIFLLLGRGKNTK